MWDGLFILLSLSSLIAIASFLAGSLPLSVSLSQRRLRLLSTIGTGVLIGTALIVIIPEGVETLYGAPTVDHVTTAGSPVKGGMGIHALHQLPRPGQDHMDQHHSPRMKEFRRSDTPSNVAERHSEPQLDVAIPEAKRADASDHPDSHDHNKSSPHALIGLALVSGFMLMYLIDVLPLLAPHPAPAPQTIGLYDLSSSPPTPSAHSAVRRSTTLGLTIHAVADGIALGAASASASTRTTLGLVVFAAIMLHKAPAAFGLTALLLKHGLGKRTARAHLVVFSLAAPAGAIATWALVNLLGGSGAGARWTGAVLVFSGGTFLYVATHALAEQHDAACPAAGPSPLSAQAHALQPSGPLRGAYAVAEDDDGALQSPYATPVLRRAQGTTPVDIACMVAGMLLPLVTQIGHVHAHGG